MTGYFDYLCRKVGIGGPMGRPYRRLALWLLCKPFKVNIPGDQNREADGLELRRGYSDAPTGECRVMEVLVALCKKMVYMADGMVNDDLNSEAEWFFQMIDNLGLGNMDDEHWDRSAEDAEQIASDQVNCWLDRRYEYDGSGGIFPLDHPHNDQANVELWYQMNAYLMEQIGNF